MSPTRKAIEKKARRKRPELAELMSVLLDRLRSRRPHFHSHRSMGSVRIDQNGTTKGYVNVEKASDSVGVSLQAKMEWGGGRRLPMVFSKSDQMERKKVAYVCAFVASLLDDRPSEERVSEPCVGVTDPKAWFDAFPDGYDGELKHAYEVRKAVSEECRSLIDVFSEVDAAAKSALRQDVSEAVDRVRKELPFLVGRLSAEEWLKLYHEAVVDGVHGL